MQGLLNLDDLPSKVPHLTPSLPCDECPKNEGAEVYFMEKSGEDIFLVRICGMCGNQRRKMLDVVSEIN